MFKNGMYVALGIVLTTISVVSAGTVLGNSEKTSEPARYEFHLVAHPANYQSSIMWGVVIDTASGVVNTWSYQSNSEYYLQPAVIPFFQE